MRIIAILLGLVACFLGGCGGGGGGDDDVGIGWVTIDSSDVNSVTSTCTLSGEAFISRDYVGHRCVGLGCISGSFDNSSPGVEVTWRNLTTGTQGTASSRYGTATSWDHLYSASVPLAFGANQLQVTAADPEGNVATTSVSVEYIPTAPGDLRANSDDGQIILHWSPIPDATGYRLYWTTTPDVAFTHGTVVDVIASPFIHSGLFNGTTYYYAITSQYLTDESLPSAEIHTTAGAPSRPINVVTTLLGGDVQLSWDDVVTADSYTLYWVNESGVTKQTGAPIFNVVSPFLHTNLSGQPYYYIISAVNGIGESLGSEEVRAFPPLAPPAPVGLSVAELWGGSGSRAAVDLTWQPVAGVTDYDIYRCFTFRYFPPGDTVDCEPAPGYCALNWELIGTSITEPSYVDGTVDTSPYWYYITARNSFGRSGPSNWAGLCVQP